MSFYAILLLIVSGQIELVAPAVNRVLSEEEIAATAASESERNDTDTNYVANAAVTNLFCKYQYKRGDAVIPFRLLRPIAEEEGKEYPLIVYFGGRGEMNGDNESHLAHLHHAIKTLTRADFFFLTVQYVVEEERREDFFLPAPGGGTYYDVVEEIYEQLLKEYPIDKTKVSVAGLCGGAGAAYMFASRHKETVTSLVVISAGPPAVNLDGIPLVIYNSVFDTVPIKEVRRYVRSRKEKGEIVYLNDTLCGHADTSLPFGKDEIFNWLLSQKKGEEPTRPSFLFCSPNTWYDVLCYIVFPLVCFFIIFNVRRRNGRWI
jgi:predicted peptidase